MIHNSYESLHFKLSMARWLKNILVRVNSKIYVWNLDQALKQICRPHEDLLENQMTMVLGLQKRLQLQVILEVVDIIYSTRIKLGRGGGGCVLDFHLGCYY